MLPTPIHGHRAVFLPAGAWGVADVRLVAGKPSSGAAPCPPSTTFHGPTPTLASIGATAALGLRVSPVAVKAMTPRPLAVTPIAGYVKS